MVLIIALDLTLPAKLRLALSKEAFMKNPAKEFFFGYGLVAFTFWAATMVIAGIKAVKEDM